ncbi:FkbM family methyltransferase [Fibrella sp. WM1]|uniref:FkbM family methyltransferase n=1 Tax=Fibrella musci TaxID=3242485 RepID=UPI003520FDEC
MTFLEKIAALPAAVQGYLFTDPGRNGEYHFLKRLLKYKHKPTVIDVGANIGEYARYALSINNSAHIHCFEPVSSTFQKLSKNLINTSAILNNVGLSDQRTEASINVYGETWGINSLYALGERVADLAPPRLESIQLSTLDRYVAEAGLTTIDFLKIDVEGHELNVLRGATRTLANKQIHAIQFEYNYLWKQTSNTLEGVFDLLGSDFAHYRLTPWGKWPVGRRFSASLENYPAAANYVALLRR